MKNVFEFSESIWQRLINVMYQKLILRVTKSGYRIPHQHLPSLKLKWSAYTQVYTWLSPINTTWMFLSYHSFSSLQVGIIVPHCCCSLRQYSPAGGIPATLPLCDLRQLLKAQEVWTTVKRATTKQKAKQNKKREKQQYILNQFPTNQWLPNWFNRFTKKAFEQNFN